MIKRIIKYLYLRYKGVNIDYISKINFSIFKNCKWCDTIFIRNSNLNLKFIGPYCFLENVVTYGDIELERCVSISGPGTVLHAVSGKIRVGAFTSIGQNVSINEFNHKTSYPSTYAMNYHFFSKNFEDDVVSKGDIIIEEDVWIGSNSCILSGVKLGRGCIVAAGSVVTKDVPAYSIVGGVPAKVIKKRFAESMITQLEDSKWWTWSIERIKTNQSFFNEELL